MFTLGICTMGKDLRRLYLTEFTMDLFYYFVSSELLWLRPIKTSGRLVGDWIRGLRGSWGRALRRFLATIAQSLLPCWYIDINPAQPRCSFKSPGGVSMVHSSTACRSVIMTRVGNAPLMAMAWAIVYTFKWEMAITYFTRQSKVRTHV